MFLGRKKSGDHLREMDKDLVIRVSQTMIKTMIKRLILFCIQWDFI